MVQSFQENFLHSVLVIYITYDPVIPGKMKTNAHKMTCTQKPLFIHSPVGGYLGHFQFLDMNEVAMNIFVEVFL